MDIDPEYIKVMTKELLESVFVTTRKHRPCFTDEKGRKYKATRKNIADLLQEIIYLIQEK